MTRERVVLALGALVVATVLTSWLVVEARTGPFEHAVHPADRASQLTATVTTRSAEPTGALDPVCQAGAPSPPCPEQTITVELEVTGLPLLQAPMAYHAFLTGPDRALWLGALQAEGQAHTLSTSSQEATDGLDRLIVTLENDQPGEPSPFLLHQVPVLEAPSARSSASFTGPANPVTPLGGLQLAQVGLVEVSTTAKAEIAGLVAAPGWTYHAYLVDQRTDRGTQLGTLELASGGIGRLDARVERVVLDEQDRFVVTLAPEALAGAGGPVGYPVVDLGLAS